MSEFPKGWAWTTLGEIARGGGLLVDGDWVESKDQDPAGDVRLIQLADVGDGQFRDKSSRFLTSQKARDLRCTYLQTNDVLVARMPDPLGRACIYPRSLKPAVTVVDVCIIRPSGAVDPRFLMNMINSPLFRYEISRLQSGSTRKRISRLNLSRLTLPVPPLPEQRRIVAEIEKQFTRLDEAARIFEQVNRNLIALTGAALNAVQPLTEDGTYRVRVREVAEMIQYGSSAKATRDSSGIPILRMGNISRDGRIAPDDLKYLPRCHDEFPALLLRNGDLLFNRTNSAELVGKSAVYQGNPSPCTFASYLIRVRLNGECAPDFLAASLNSPYGRRWVRSVANQQVGQANVNGTKLGNFQFALPHLDEQRRRIEILDSTMSLIWQVADLYTLSSRRAARLRQAILAKAFSGRLVPQDPNDEPASLLLERIHRESSGYAMPKPSRKRKRPQLVSQ